MISSICKSSGNSFRSTSPLSAFTRTALATRSATTRDSSVTPASSSFTHKIAYIIGNTTMFTSDAIPAGTNKYAHTIEHSWLPKLNSANMVVRLFTYSSSTQNSSTQIGVTDKSVTVTVPAGIVPTVSSLTATVVNGLGGYYVEGKSKVKLVATAKEGTGSSLSSYIFSGANINSSSSTLTTTNSTVTSSVIQKEGNLTYGVIAKDGRPARQSEKVETSIYVYPYAKPQITSITAQRCKSDGTLDDNGTYARVVIKTSHSPVNAANYITVRLSNSLNSTSYDVVVKSYASKEENTYTVKAYGGSFAINSSYTITATITDNYNTGTTLTKSATLKAAKRTLNIAKYGNGISIGALSTVTSSSASGLFETSWPINMYQGGQCNGFIDFTSVGVQDGLRFNKYDSTGALTRAVKLYKGETNVHVGLWDGTTEKAVWQYRALDDGTDELFINQPTKINNTVNALRGRFTSTVDADSHSQVDVALRVGSPSSNHLDIDGNEIIAKYGTSEPATLYFVGSAIGMYSNDTLAMTIGADSTGEYVQSVPVYTRTYTGAANMYVNSNGTFGRSTASSERYKKDIEDVTNKELNPYKILDIPVRQFRYNEENIPVDGKPDDLYIGLIAEEVNKAYPIATEYTEDGQIEMWNIKMLFPALLKIVQDQQQKIEALEEQINNKAVN